MLLMQQMYPFCSIFLSLSLSAKYVAEAFYYELSNNPVPPNGIIKLTSLSQSSDILFRLFTIHELECVLRSCNSAPFPEPDGIRHFTLEHLGAASTE